MEYKVGTKVLCKHAWVTNNRIDNSVEGQMIHFFKNMFYEIVDYREHDGEWVFVLKSELSNKCRIRIDNMRGFFYTEKELRKLKLEKLESWR